METTQNNTVPKKILFICTEHAAGMLSFASTIINTAADDPECEIFAIAVSRDDLSYRQTLNPKVKRKTVFLEYPTSKIGQLIYQLYPLKLLKAIDKTCRQHGITTLHCLTGEYNLAYHMHKLKQKYEIYYTLHDLRPHEAHNNGTKQRLTTRYLTQTTQKNIEIADNIVTCSQTQYLQLIQDTPTKKLYYHRFPSLITPRIANGTETCPELEGVKDYILFFGRIELYKGLKYLYKACYYDKTLSQTPLVLAGYGDYGFQMAGDANIIKINRFIRDTEVAQLFKNAACAVYPYISATQSGVIMLSYYFSTPVIASNVDFFEECIEDEKTGLLFENKNTFDLADKIKRILTDTELRNLMRKEQKRFLEQKHTHEALLRELSLIYSGRAE